MLRNILQRTFTTSANAGPWHHTTILALKHKGETVIIGDGQVSQGSIRVKTDGKKIRKLG